MNLPNVTINELLEAGVHFGHNTRRWNPKMEQFIFGVRNNIHIIDLRLTIPLIDTALVKLYDVVSKSGKVLIVGTKKQAANIVENISKETGQFYINKRWLGGTLTNWKTINNSIKKLVELENILTDKKAKVSLSKKELLNISREKDKLILNIGGIRNLVGKPDLLLVFDVIKDKLAVLEAKKLNIPVIGILDTNADPELVDFPIPGNDDGLRSINLFANLFKTTIEEANKSKEVSNIEDSKNEITKKISNKKSSIKKENPKKEEIKNNK